VMSASACSREVTLKAPAPFACPVRLSADMGHSGDVLQVGDGTLANERDRAPDRIERPGTRRNGRRGRRSGGRKRAKCGGPAPGAFELPGRVAVEMDIVPLGHVRIIRELHYVPDLIARHASSADTAHGADAGTAHGPISTSRRQLSATDRLTGSFSEKGFIKHVGSPVVLAGVDSTPDATRPDAGSRQPRCPMEGEPTIPHLGISRTKKREPTAPATNTVLADGASGLKTGSKVIGDAQESKPGVRSVLPSVRLHPGLGLTLSASRPKCIWLAAPTLAIGIRMMAVCVPCASLRRSLCCTSKSVR
jgi:hypothetical protein